MATKKVECIQHGLQYLTYGKVYEVTEEHEYGYTVTDDTGDITAYFSKHRFKVVEEVTGKVTSDGSSTDYYQLPSDASDLLDLIEHKNMSFGVGNIFKACYRLGEKSGTDAAYDLRKMIFFATRELARIEKSSS